jgi:hypothetical protein
LRDARLAAALLAATPGLLGAVVGTASLGGVLLALGAAAAVATIVSREAAGMAPPRGGAWTALDLVAWWAGAGSLALTIILSSPAPEIVSTPTPGRRLVLAVAGCVALASVLIALHRGPTGRTPLA